MRVLFSGDSETYSPTYYNRDVSAGDSSFQLLPPSSTQSTPTRRPPHRVAFVEPRADVRRRLSSSSSSGSRRPPLPPGTVDRRQPRPISRAHHPQVTDARSRRHLQQRARQRAMRCSSWHSLTTPATSEPSSEKSTRTQLHSPTDTGAPKSPKTEVPTSSGGGGSKFRFLSMLFGKKSSSQSAVDSTTATIDRRPSLRSALRGAGGSNLPRSASAERINETTSSNKLARPTRTVRWDISPEMDKTVVIPTWKRPKKVIVQESSV